MTCSPKTPGTAGSKARGGHHARPLVAASAAALAILVGAVLAHAPQPSALDAPSEFFSSMAGEAKEASARQVEWDNFPECVVAWVEVPGTSIDEPIAQADAACPNRYLYEDALGRGAYGTPYLDCDCAVDSPFAVVYGHHMSDGSVFAGFASFSDAAYAQEHRSILVYTRADGTCHELEVVAADVVDASRELVRTTFDSDAARIAYLEEALGRSDVVLDPEGASSAAVWAFATCSYQTPNSRTVVYAAERR